MKKNIKDYNLEELKEEFIKLEEKPYRAEQVFKWIHQANVTSFDEMTNISLELREKLKEEFTLCVYNIIRKQESKDGTKKYLFDVLDGNAIETVLMEYKHRKIYMCIKPNWMQNGMQILCINWNRFCKKPNSRRNYRASISGAKRRKC